MLFILILSCENAYPIYFFELFELYRFGFFKIYNFVFVSWNAYFWESNLPYASEAVITTEELQRQLEECILLYLNYFLFLTR